MSDCINCSDLADSFAEVSPEALDKMMPFGEMRSLIEGMSGPFEVNVVSGIPAIESPLSVTFPGA